MTTILLVEDDEILLENISLELQMHGYQVLEADNGRRAMEILGRQRPHIIVSDISMPDVDGFELLDQVRNNGALRSIPMLFLTALSSPDSIRRGKKLGIDDYIVKPFQVDDLIVAIENKLRRSEAYRDEAIQEVDELRRHLLQLLAHELRTPLVPIQGGAEMLTEYLAEMPDDYIKNMLDLIHSGVGRITRLANRSLALLRLDSGEFRETYEKYGGKHSLYEIVLSARVAVEQARHLFDANSELVIIDCPEPLFVYGIYEYLQMMVEEPLRNAMEFAPDNSTVSVEIRQDGEWGIIAIKDQGPGIVDEDLDRIWDRFEKIKEDHIAQGAGLGLAIMRQTARAHGGTCEIQGTPGRGTCVSLRLPLTTIEG